MIMMKSTISFSFRVEYNNNTYANSNNDNLIYRFPIWVFLFPTLKEANDCPCHYFLFIYWYNDTTISFLL